MTTPTCGDDLFTRSVSKLGRMIAWATRGKSEGPTLATHQGKFFDCDRLVEAHWPRVKYTAWSQRNIEMTIDGAEWCIVSPCRPFDLTEREKIQDTLAESVGWRYSCLELPLQLLDGMIAKRRKQPRRGYDVILFRRLGRLWKTGVICSKTANRADIAIGRVPKWLEYGAPDDTWDFKISGAGAGQWYIKDHSPGWLLPRFDGATMLRYGAMRTA